MAPLRIIACDDEPLALQRIADLLSCCTGVELVETILDAREVVGAVQDHRPDLLLLDIEMPKLRGFDIIDRLAQEDFGEPYFPQIVIVTAHLEFAAMAYETGALDFLSKPVRLRRLELSLTRVRQALAQRSVAERLEAMTVELERLRALHVDDDPSPAELWIRSRGETIRIDVDQITRIEAEGVHVRVHTPRASYLHRETVASLAARLDSRFVRIHRGDIVRIDRIASVRRNFHGALTVLLASGEELPVGRTYREALSALVARKPAVAAAEG